MFCRGKTIKKQTKDEDDYSRDDGPNPVSFIVFFPHILPFKTFSKAFCKDGSAKLFIKLLS
jgi:hypothetical protein